jgi:hypothetical protein
MRDVSQPELFDAPLIAEAEIDAACPTQVSSEARDQNVIVSRDGALDTAAWRNVVLADTRPIRRGTLEEGIADNHAEASLARQAADSLGEFHDSTEPIAAPVALEQVLLDGVLFGIRQHPEPVVGEDGGIKRV